MKLTLREQEVLTLIAHGYTDRQIASQLVITLATARKHRENVLAKFQFRRSSQLVAEYFTNFAKPHKKSR